ncbi:hypothetical protein RHSIM_Rhsim12G0106300 [Rhododendron simsii]|uniref:Uncharacterized protein n=1 Tax=Rhododendron simsii TaxID=118357 RepID=A0A834G4F6_RHOSS|nr:hypothetical protein RHSIM_Rhsim12G0106300 [Rhododendron simsii]
MTIPAHWSPAGGQRTRSLVTTNSAALALKLANDDSSYFGIKVIVDSSTHLIEGEEDEGSLRLPKLTSEDKEHVKFIKIPVDKLMHEGTLSTISDMLSAVEIPKDDQPDMLDDITSFALSMAPKNNHNVGSKVLTMIIRIDAANYVVTDDVDVAV